jgi:hypothetical protein
LLSTVLLLLVAAIVVLASVYDRRCLEQCGGFKNQRLDIDQRFEGVLRETFRAEAFRSKFDVLFKRDAISPVKRSTISAINSSAIGVSIQDSTMHALFEALVQSDVRKSRRSLGVFIAGDRPTVAPPCT